MKTQPLLSVSPASGSEGKISAIRKWKWWGWLSNSDRQRNLAFIGGGMSALIAGIWAIYIYSNDKPPFYMSTTTNLADSGSVAIIGSNNAVTIGITLEQHEASLKRREQEIRQEYDKAIGGGRLREDKQKISLLEKELNDVQAQAQNIAASLLDRKATLVRAGQALVELNHDNPTGALDQALQALYKGYTVAAEAFFKRAMAAGNEQAAESALQLGNLAYNRIDYGKAYRYYVEAARLQPQNPEYLHMAGRIASDLGFYAEAKDYFEKSLALRKKSLSAGHPTLAQSMNNLAQLYHLQGQYVQSESLFKDALVVYEKVLGPNHLTIALTLNNLAELYRTQDQYAQAEPLYKRSLAIQEKALGPNHPDMAPALSNLALLYTAQEQYTVAEPLLKRSIAMQEKTKGPNHPMLAASLNNLGLLYQDQGNNVQAEPLYKRSLEIHENVYGPNHPKGATILSNLAVLYETQKQYTQAEPLYKRSLEIAEKNLDPNHPEVIRYVNNLVSFYRRTGREKEAMAMANRETIK